MSDYLQQVTYFRFAVVKLDDNDDIVGPGLIQVFQHFHTVQVVYMLKCF